MMIIAFIASFCLYFLYTGVVYFKAKTTSIKTHLMFSTVNAILWGLKTYDLPYWTVIPLALNSTRIELWFHSLVIHANNVPFAVLKFLQNFLLITFLFYLSRQAKMSASLVLSILTIDIIQAVLWEFKVIQYVQEKSRRKKSVR